jgi:outer membrane lipoprotein SlyB
VAKSAGRFKGNAELGIALDSVTINGESYDIKTAPVVRTSEGCGKRTAIGAGAGAAAGAVIGAIAGGGKGAAIGAGAGAGAGTAGAALTGERDVTVPAETKLNFRLAQPVEIQAT